MSRVLMLSFVLISCCVVFAAEQSVAPTIMPLWDDTVPGILGSAEKDIPTLTVYPVSGETVTDCAIVICPGGGYGHLAIDHEGRQIAEWFNSIGVTAFVLKYRLPSDGYRHPVPLMDAQQAIRAVRHKASKWNIDTAQIGIIGFSAGGHLASSVGTHFEKPVKIEQGSEEFEAMSCRPDFMVLIYPVISMQDGITHQGSKNNLLGENPDTELVSLVSNENQVTSQTPPTFLVHANDDNAVVPENSLRFYEALRKADVPAEMHIYLKGGHGFGIRAGAGPAAEWPRLCKQWMQQLGFLPE